jgi:hypothetical protein
MSHEHEMKREALPPAQSEVLVIGLVRDAAPALEADLGRLRQALGDAQRVHGLIIESDSQDETLPALRRVQASWADCRVMTLGNLRDQMPVRTVRLAHCRNLGVEALRRDAAYAAVDWVVVADLDGVNTHLTAQAVRSCWARSDWDMCSANQAAPYYDIWALRHPQWSPNDCWAQHRFYEQFEPNRQRSLYCCVYVRMIQLPATQAWVKVDSAFGGLAIYRRSVYERGHYSGLTEGGEEVCEHVPFHATLQQLGARLFINPALINAEWTEHSRPLAPR